MDLFLAKSQFSNYRNSPFRSFQEEAIKYILNSEKRIVVLEAATGSGKSVCGLISGAAMGGVTYLVHTKILQEQITSDFPEAQSLFGRSNYSCLSNPEVTCDECNSTPHAFCEYKKTKCPYEIRKRSVLKSSYKILNYNYFLSECNYVGKFSGAPFIVVDEADSLEQTLIDFTTLQFSPFALRRLGMLDMASNLKMSSKYKDNLLESWKSFGVQAKYRVNSIIKKLTSDIESWGENISEQQVSVIKERSRVIRLKEKIDLFLHNVSSDWILDNQEGSRLIFRPLWLTPELAENYFWRHGTGKFVLMSASFYPKHILAKTLGLEPDDIDWHVVPSQFPLKNRQVYIHPVSNMTAKTTNIEAPKLLPMIRQIVDSRPVVKGIIHAVSYKLAHYIVDNINNPRFITHNSNNRQEILDDFITTESPMILVSPSLERGVSLDEDKCRLVIVVKAPYLSLGDKIISSRLYSGAIGQNWYTATMLLTLLQMCGRAVRSKDDFAEMFILDLQAKNAITRYPNYLPSWWLDALEFELPEDMK